VVVAAVSTTLENECLSSFSRAVVGGVPETRRERVSPLSSRLWWQQITTTLKNELCTCFQGWWSSGGGSSIYHLRKRASELVFEGSGWWGTCLMVSNTKRKRNIAGVPCMPTPRVRFLLVFSLFAFEVAACQ